MNKSPVLLVHHAANRDHNYPPCSIQSLKSCLAAGARAIEVDISPLADGRFVLLHGPHLETSTTGSGPVSLHTAAEAGKLYYTRQGHATIEKVGFLKEALELLEGHSHPVELQLDLKPHAFLGDEALSNLVTALGPVKERVRISSVADWVLRRLRRLDANLRLGFDPLLYLDVGRREASEPPRPPFRQGAFAYWDDHPLASHRWGSPSDYLAARAEALLAQAPPAVIWYISARTLAQALDDNFDWIAYLHERGSKVAAWTLDPEGDEQIMLTRRLIDRGVDRITTNQALALAERLERTVLY